MDTIQIESKLNTPKSFDSFFGPVVLEPGLNPPINIRLWRNLKANNSDVQSLLKQDILLEVED